MPIKSSKCRVWFQLYTDRSNPKTFLKPKASAIAAGYNCKTDQSYASMGNQNMIRWGPTLKTWFDEVGMSDEVLKSKTVAMLDATETKFFSTPFINRDGEQDILVKEREVKALKIQVEALKLATKIRGMLAPEKHEHTIDEKTLSVILSALPTDYRKAVRAALGYSDDTSAAKH